MVRRSRVSLGELVTGEYIVVVVKIAGERHLIIKLVAKEDGQKYGVLIWRHAIQVPGVRRLWVLLNQ